MSVIKPILCTMSFAQTWGIKSVQFKNLWTVTLLLLEAFTTFFRSYYFFFSNPMAGFYSTSYLWYCAIGWFVTMLIGTVTSFLLGERQIKQLWVVCEPCSQDLRYRVWDDAMPMLLCLWPVKSWNISKIWVNDLFSVCFWACLFVIGPFTVVCLVTKSLIWSEVGVDHVVIETSI